LREDLGATIAFEEDDENNNAEDLDSEDEEVDDNHGEGPSKSAVLSLLGVAPVKGKKTIFVDTAKEGKLESFPLPAHMTQAEHVHLTVAKFKPQKLVNRLMSMNTSTSSKGKGKAIIPSEEEREEVLQAKKERKALLADKTAELAARLDRLKTLQRTFREMQVQRAIMGKGSKMVAGNKSKGLSTEEERLNEGDLDELELRQMGNKKKKLPEPEQGIRTGARVWKWKTERHR
jgi:U3 small nucleolar RNA-associated protein 11